VGSLQEQPAREVLPVDCGGPAGVRGAGGGLGAAVGSGESGGDVERVAGRDRMKSEGGSWWARWRFRLSRDGSWPWGGSRRRRAEVRPEVDEELKFHIEAMTASGFRVARVSPVMGRPLIDADERREGAPLLGAVAPRPIGQPAGPGAVAERVRSSRGRCSARAGAGGADDDRCVDGGAWSSAAPGPGSSSRRSPSPWRRCRSQ